MSVNINYLRRVIEDLAERVDKVMVNGVETEIVDIIVDGRELIVNTERVDDISFLSNVKLLDEKGNIIIERNPNRNTESSRSLEFRFEIEVE